MQMLFDTAAERNRTVEVFNGINKRLKLKLIQARTFSSGNVLLSYQQA